MNGVPANYRVHTTARSNGEARVFHLILPEGEGPNYLSRITNQQGWNELLMWEKGSYPGYPLPW
ncbi:MAG: hypothetical protein KGZ25_06235 [Planctomycetes bacterium]|nr:hypothetical protein [Planctomycetota bacterium]